MSRDRRSTEEDPLWGNPCDYGANFQATKYSAKLASRVANQARSAFKSTSLYKDELAYWLHSYATFEKLLPVWSSVDWLRNFTWFKEVLPKEKVLGREMPAQYLDDLMKHIDDVLPVMYKGLKMVVAGLHSIHETLNENPRTDLDESMRDKISQSVKDVQAVLCVFFDLMKARNLEIMPLLKNDVPNINMDDSLLVYRDTLNYLEYLAQVFQKMNDVEPTA